MDSMINCLTLNVCADNFVCIKHFVYVLCTLVWFKHIDQQYLPMPKHLGDISSHYKVIIQYKICLLFTEQREKFCIRRNCWQRFLAKRWLYSIMHSSCFMLPASAGSVQVWMNELSLLGPGIVTRRPLILQLVYSPSRWKKNRKSESDGSGDESPELEEVEPEEWGKFSHIKDKVCLHLFKCNIKVILLTMLCIFLLEICRLLWNQRWDRKGDWTINWP